MKVVCLNENESLIDNILKESDEGIYKFSKTAFNNMDKSENDLDLGQKKISNENLDDNEIMKLPLKERLKKRKKLKVNDKAIKKLNSINKNDTKRKFMYPKKEEEIDLRQKKKVRLNKFI